MLGKGLLKENLAEDVDPEFELANLIGESGFHEKSLPPSFFCGVLCFSSEIEVDCPKVNTGADLGSSDAVADFASPNANTEGEALVSVIGVNANAEERFSFSSTA